MEESNAAAFHLATDDLRGGSDDDNRALVLQWMNMAEGEVLPPAHNLTFKRIGLIQPVATPDEDMAGLRRVLEVVDGHLAMRTFLVGERMSLGDVCLAASLMLLFERGLTPGERAGFAHLLRWFDTVVNQKAFVDVLGGKFAYCQTVKKVSDEGSRLKTSFCMFS